MTEAITNPNAQEAIADPWAVVLGDRDRKSVV